MLPGLTIDFRFLNLSYQSKHDSKAILDSWLSQHREDFVSRPIFLSELEETFASQQIQPNELKFRGKIHQFIDIIYKVNKLSHWASAIELQEILSQSKWSKTLTLTHMQVLQDELCGRKIDKALTKFFNIEQKWEQNLTEKFKKIRCEYIQPLWGMNPAICVYKNKICWEQSPVILLRGRGNELTGETQESALYLKTPCENDGKFFCLDLAEQNTIIMGPKKTLKPYEKKYPNYRLVYIEDLSDSQRKVLQYIPQIKS